MGQSGRAQCGDRPSAATGTVAPPRRQHVRGRGLVGRCCSPGVAKQCGYSEGARLRARGARSPPAAPRSTNGEDSAQREPDQLLIAMWEVGQSSWRSIAEDLGQMAGAKLTDDQVRVRYRRLLEKVGDPVECPGGWDALSPPSSD